MSSKAKKESVGKVTLRTKKIGRKRYGAALCFVSGMGNVNIPAVAVLAGKEQRVSTFEDCVLWLSSRGLTLQQARDFINEATAGDRLGPDAGDWTISVTHAHEFATASSPHVLANLHGDIATCPSRHVAARLTYFPALLAIVRELVTRVDTLNIAVEGDTIADVVAEANADRAIELLGERAKELLTGFDAGDRYFPKE